MNLQQLSEKYGCDLNYLNDIDSALREHILKMIEESFILEKHLEIKKLVKNSVGYLMNNQIEELNDKTYNVNGKHNKYIVHIDGNEYQCECPMYKRQGKYSNVVCETCSHVQAIQLYKFVDTNKQKNVYLLQGDPGAGKSHCINTIIDNYPHDSRSIVVMDTHLDGIRDSFNLVTRKGTTVISQNTFATKKCSGDFNESVGKWYVNPLVFKEHAVPIIYEIIEKINTMDDNETFLFVIDELGKMQSTSPVYVDAIQILFTTIDNNKNKKFKGIFVVPTDDAKWNNLSKLKTKYKTFNININTRTIDQEQFIGIILSDQK